MDACEARQYPGLRSRLSRRLPELEQSTPGMQEVHVALVGSKYLSPSQLLQASTPTAPVPDVVEPNGQAEQTAAPELWSVSL